MSSFSADSPLVIRIGDPEDLQNSDGDTYTAYPIHIEDPFGEIWQIRRRYKHFSELYYSLKEKYSEIELFDFPKKKLLSSSSSEKLFRKESFHIFLNLLLTLKPMPRELEHFLEVRKHQKKDHIAASASSRASFESSQSIESIATAHHLSVDSLSSSSLNNSKNSQTNEKKVSQHSSPSAAATLITLTPMALFAYILLFSTWVGSSVWLYIKGTDYETLLWTNIGVLVITLYLLKQDREILLTYHQNKKNANEELSPSPAQEIQIQSPVSDSSQQLSPLNCSVDWIQAFNGEWKIIKQENAVESWYPMAGINFLIRPIALTVLMTLVKKITISNGVLEIERSFNGKKYWKAVIKIAKNKETAEVLETEVDGVKSNFCCWIDENEKALYLEFEPFDQKKGIWVKHRREVLPNGELKMSWDGLNLGTGTKGIMTTYFLKSEY